LYWVVLPDVFINYYIGLHTFMIKTSAFILNMVLTNRDVKVCMLTASMNLTWDMK